MDDQAIDQALPIIAALAHCDRLAIMVWLTTHEARVGELQRLRGITQPATSNHLRLLFDAGLVRRRRDGRFVSYSIDADGWDAAVAALNAVVTPQP